MNMFDKEGNLIVLRNNSIMDYVEDKLGADVVKELEKEKQQVEDSVESTDYELDLAWDSIYHLESAIREGNEGLKKLLYYLRTTKRINRDKLQDMVINIQNSIDLDKIEY